MIKPVLQNDAFLEDVLRAKKDPGQLHLWWLGQTGYLIQWQGRHLLLDPYLSDSLTRKYANTSKPHVRMTTIWFKLWKAKQEIEAVKKNAKNPHFKNTTPTLTH